MLDSLEHFYSEREEVQEDSKIKSLRWDGYVHPERFGNSGLSAGVPLLTDVSFCSPCNGLAHHRGC